MSNPQVTPFIQCDLEFGKQTKNMIKFVANQDLEVARRATVADIYVRQTALANAFGKFPAKVRITIEEVV